ncbi:MAG: hypothetical protein MJD61_18380 [Proteobacteria bacterium]|nr:hypothetical protein [Pseudomonadota bacterium]
MAKLTPVIVSILSLAGLGSARADIPHKLRGPALSGVHQSVAWCTRPGERLSVRLTTNASGRVVQAGLLGFRIGQPGSHRGVLRATRIKHRERCVAESLAGVMLGPKYGSRKLVAHLRMPPIARAHSALALRGTPLKGIRDSVSWCALAGEHLALKLRTNGSGRVREATLAGYHPAASLRHRGGTLKARRATHRDRCIAEALEGAALGRSLANRTLLVRIQQRVPAQRLPAQAVKPHALPMLAGELPGPAVLRVATPFPMSTKRLRRAPSGYLMVQK